MVSNGLCCCADGLLRPFGWRTTPFLFWFVRHIPIAQFYAMPAHLPPLPGTSPAAWRRYCQRIMPMRLRRVSPPFSSPRHRRTLRCVIFYGWIYMPARCLCYPFRTCALPAAQHILPRRLPHFAYYLLLHLRAPTPHTATTHRCALHAPCAPDGRYTVTTDRRTRRRRTAKNLLCLLLHMRTIYSPLTPTAGGP